MLRGKGGRTFIRSWKESWIIYGSCVTGRAPRQVSAVVTWVAPIIAMAIAMARLHTRHTMCCVLMAVLVG